MIRKILIGAFFSLISWCAIADPTQLVIDNTTSVGVGVYINNIPMGGPGNQTFLELADMCHQVTTGPSCELSFMATDSRGITSSVAVFLVDSRTGMPNLLAINSYAGITASYSPFTIKFSYATKKIY